jgi:hypothetical protein
MGNVQNARTAIEVLTQQPGNVRSARTAVEVVTQQRGNVRSARTAVEALTQTPKVALARTAVEVLLSTNWAEVLWGVALNIVPPVVTYISDNFNRSDTSVIGAGSVGPAPVEYTGDWSINGNQLLAPGSGEAVIGWETGHTSYASQFTLANLNVDPVACVRLVDNANFVGMQMYAGGTCAIYQRIGGGYGALTSQISVPWANGDVVKTIVTPTRIEVYRNGALVQGVDTTVLATATKVGFRTNGGACRFDNLLVTDH